MNAIESSAPDCAHVPVRPACSAFPISSVDSVELDQTIAAGIRPIALTCAFRDLPRNSMENKLIARGIMRGGT